MKCKRRQYGLHHYVTGTIYGAMGDIYNPVAILVINIENLFSLLGRSQLILFYPALG